MDFQCCDLDDSHTKSMCAVIKEQYELKDQMAWKFGLRNKERLNIKQLGLKYINLARNNFGDEFVTFLHEILNMDVYIRCLSLRHNKVGTEGLKVLSKISLDHMGILSIDSRNNPGHCSLEKHSIEIMKYSYLRNIRSAVKRYFKFKHRIKLEWVFPNAVGLSENDLDDKNPSPLPQANRNLFISLV